MRAISQKNNKEWEGKKCTSHLFLCSKWKDMKKKLIQIVIFGETKTCDYYFLRSRVCSYDSCPPFYNNRGSSGISLRLLSYKIFISSFRIFRERADGSMCFFCHVWILILAHGFFLFFSALVLEVPYANRRTKLTAGYSAIGAWFLPSPADQRASEGIHRHKKGREVDCHQHDFLKDIKHYCLTTTERISPSLPLLVLLRFFQLSCWQCT